MGGRTGDPWALHPHPLSLAVLAGLALLWTAAVLRWGRPSRRQRWIAAAALVSLVVAVAWPVADLAARWSLVALMAQRLVLTLAAAPLILMATPPDVLAALTRRAPVDVALETLTRPGVAVAVFTVVAVGTLAPPLVEAQATSVGARAGLDALVLAAGFVLWGPVLRAIPGASRVGPLGTAVYLFVQSLVPTFLAVVLVFARHPFYAVYAHAAGAVGLSPLADQQVAGIVGKVGTLPVLWAVAWMEIVRARRLEEVGADPQPLVWRDVQRQLERAERRQGRRSDGHGGGRPGRPDWRPRLTTRFPTVEPPADGEPGHEGPAAGF